MRLTIVPPIHAATVSTPTAADVRRDATVAAVERVMPAVVNIATETVVEINDPLEDLFREFFNPYYRRRAPKSQAETGLPAGLKISALRS